MLLLPQLLVLPLLLSLPLLPLLPDIYATLMTKHTATVAVSAAASTAEVPFAPMWLLV